MLAVIWATKQFRCYLYGNRFKDRTDHLAPSYLHKFTWNNSRLFRWSLRLNEFDFEIEQRPRHEIRLIDALSRHVQAINSSQTIPKEIMKAKQGTDKFCNSKLVGKVM
jgi:hypothetical protein